MGLGVLIVTISFNPNIGGLETHLDDLCRYLTRRKHRVYVISYQPLTTNVRGNGREKKDLMQIYRIPWFGQGLFHKLESYPTLEFMYLTPMLLLSSLLFMLRHYRHVNVVHVHGLNAAFVGNVLRSVLGKRSIASIHTVYDLDSRPAFARLVKWVLSAFDTILVPSERSRRDLLAAGVSANRLKVCPEWVNLNFYRPLDKKRCKKEIGVKGKFVVLFVGRLIEKKGVQLLLNATSNLNSDDVTFLFVGAGPLSDEIRAKAFEWKNVVFAGRVPEKDLVKYYNAADITVVPSLYEEVFGRVILESISCGTPVVASNKGAIPEVLNPSAGVFVEPNVEEIKEKISYLYENQDKLLQMAKRCRKLAENRYSERNAKIIEESYIAG